MDGFKRRLNESVQLRLSVTLSLTIVVVAILAGVFAFVSAFDEALEMQDDTLRRIGSMFERQRMTLQYPGAAPAIRGDNEETRVVIQYLADGARATADDDNALPLPIPASLPDGLSSVLVGGEQFRVYVATTGDGRRLAVAQETASRDHDARESAWRGLLPFAILIPVLLLVVADLIRKLFRPIARLAAQIDRRAEQDLAPIDESHLPTEVRSFALAINRLLGRVGRSMDSQRRFVADAAHELRSPLTALSLQAERLATAPMSEQAHERLGLLRQGIERGRNLVDQLLTLASAQSAQVRPRPPLSVHQVYRRVLEDLLPLAERKAIDIGVDGDDATLEVNGQDLLTLVRNLVDNAIRYTPANGRVDLAVSGDAQAVVIQVSDSGPGIAEAERERIFDPFYRAPGTPEIGSGLGLSIVRAIASRIGASIHLDYTDPAARSGLTVRLTIPRAGPGSGGEP